MSEFDDSIARLLEQEKILFSVMGQARAKLELSQNEAEINKYEKFIEDGLTLMKEVEDKLEVVFGKRKVKGDN